MRTSRFTEAKPGKATEGLARRLAGTAAAILLSAGLAAAQAVQDYDIAAQPLRGALSQLAQTSGLNLAVPAARTAGLTSAAVQGSMSAEQALSRLARGTGLSLAIIDGTVVLTPGTRGAAPDPTLPEGAVALDTITLPGSNGAGRFSATTEYQTSASVDYISGEEVERFRGTSPGDMLSGVPGVMTGATRNSGAIDVNVRGMQGMGRVPVVVDGALQSNTEYRGYAGAADRSYVDPDLIGAVEIEKGPSLAADATGATGGVVRMKTLSAEDILLPGRNAGIRLRFGFSGNSTDAPEPNTRGGMIINNLPATATSIANITSRTYDTAGNFDRPGLLEPTSPFGSIAGAVRFGRAEFVAAYAERKMGNYFAGTSGDGGAHLEITPQVYPSGPTGLYYGTNGGLTPFRDGEEVLNSANHSRSTLLKSTFDLDGGHELELSYVNYRSTYAEIFPSTYGWQGGLYQNADSRVDADTYTASWSWNPEGSDLIDLSVRLWKTDTDYDLVFIYPYPFYTINFAWRTASERQGINVENRSRLDTGWGPLTLSYGFAYSEEDLYMDSLAWGIIEGLEVTRDARRREISAFLAAELQPRDWLKIEGGLRYTRTQADDELCTAALAEDLDCRPSYDDGGLAPIVAVTVEPWQGIQAYLRYAEAIRSPSLYEATSGTSFYGVSATMALPEHAKNWELGVNVLRDSVLLPGDQLGFKIAYFDNRVENYLTRVYGDGSLGEGLFVLRNLQSARFKGIELSASYDMGRYFANLGYNRYLDSEFCLSDADWPIPRSPDTARCNPGGSGAGFDKTQLPPKEQLSLVLGGRFFDEALTLGTRATYVGDRIVKGGGISSGGTGGFTVLSEWKPYTVFDLFATWDIDERSQIEFNIDNLTDLNYVDALAVGLTPAPGRTFRVAYTTRF